MTEEMHTECWREKFLVNLIAIQLVKKMIFHKTLRSISMCKRGCHWSCPEPFEQIPQPCTLFLTAVLIHAYLYPPVSPSLQKEQLKKNGVWIAIYQMDLQGTEMDSTGSG